MRKILFAALVAALTGLALFCSAGSAANAHGGITRTNASGTEVTTTQSLDGHIGLVAYTQYCRTVFFGDGAPMDRACTSIDTAGGGWHSTGQRTYNVPLSEGGHSDIMQDPRTEWTGAGGFELLCDPTVDGATCVMPPGAAFAQTDLNTEHVKIHSTYPAGGSSTGTTRCVFFANSGATSVTSSC